MSSVFFTADTHFGHKKIIEFEANARPFFTVEEMNEALVDNWNSVVGKKDVIYHLGDVLFGRDAFKYLGRLNGIKKLIMGNHDHYASALYLEHFTKVVPYWRFEDVLLSHVPVHPSQFPRFDANFHGHMHSKYIDDNRYVNMSVERWNLTPVEWETVRKLIPTQSQE